MGIEPFSLNFVANPKLYNDFVVLTKDFVEI